MLQSLQGQISKKSVASRYPISKAVGAHMRLWSIDQSQMSIRLLKALVGTRSSSTPSRSTPPAAFIGMQRKKKKKSTNRILQLFEIVSLLISQLTLNLQGSVPACVRQTAFKKYSCWSRLWRRIFYRTPLNEYERFVNAFVGRERRLHVLT